jgi:hypothetical protein
MEDVGILYGHLVYYFTAIWSILRLFGLFCGNLVYFTAIWYILRQFGIFLVIWYIFSRFVTPRKLWLPCLAGA